MLIAIQKNDTQNISLVELVRMCAPAQMVEDSGSETLTMEKLERAIITFVGGY